MDLDERFREELNRLGRQRDVQHLFEGVVRIRRRRIVVRRLGAAALAVVVLSGTAAAFLALSHAFGGGERVPGVGTPANGLIAYSDLNTATGDNDIFVTRSDGLRVTLLHQPGNDYDPQWSEDGTHIFFEKDGEGIFVMDADGSHQRRISDIATSAFSVSPDGETIAYACAMLPATPSDPELATPSICLMGADGSRPRSLPGTEGGSGEPAWSPDGSLLAFNREYAVWVVGTDGSDPHLVAEKVALPIWSPDGTRILFVSAHGVESIAPDGSAPQTIAHDPNVEYSDLAYAPDGSRILVTAAPFVNGQQRYEIYAMDPDGSNVEQITHVSTHERGACCLSPSWQAVPAEDGSAP
jgi:Tol biopolymer transport system component